MTSGFTEAMKARHKELRPQFDDACSELFLGNYELGWKLYHECIEYRIPAKSMTTPEWRGEDLQGKSILVVHEQGYGDSILMCRYCKLLADRGAHVIYWCPTELASVIASVPGVLGVSPTLGTPMDEEGHYAMTGTVPDTDYHVPAFALPHLFGTLPHTIPADIPYIFPTAGLADHVRKTPGFRSDTKLNVGIFWQGSKTQLDDCYRSIPLKEFAPLAAIPCVRLVSLQVGHGIEQIDEVDFKVTNFGEHFKDFMHAAAAIKALDLIVGVDSALCHLACAIGQEMWLMKSVRLDWRYPPIEPAKCNPWYPDLRIYRQTEEMVWTDVIQRVATDLARKAKTEKAQ